MAYTMLQIVEGAAKLRINFRTGDSLEPEIAQDFLERLNLMLSQMKARGLDLQFDADLETSDKFPLPDEHRLGVMAMLAVAYVDEDAPISAELKAMAIDGENLLKADYRKPDDMRVDRAFLNMSSGRRAF